ncbi:MAG: hypothetical protein A2538_01430 [Candidatus Magasanikbacteria bacterium RIFOXYD2_FULL_41_14]|uniref:Uncharacterized protein n=1 Tax=Candidatus Magasanikbacteria bacterium RIFOXYD2_FULL_41_14 TaxID=1798709 RepID=A0A1F6PDP6_9BACT|nr:MAG: hypothetical protein A2538_01430 [Candidatus Magasanikbacteria bacterium RIFOXYD2_FULL_41_14]
MPPNKPKSLPAWAQVKLTGGNYLGWRIASIIVVGTMLASALFSAWFIYHNIYNTIANSMTVVILGSSPYVEALDDTALQKARASLKLKNIVVTWPKNIRNIFSYPEIATSTIYDKKL